MTELNQEQHIQLLQFMSLMQNCKTENEMQELKEQYYNIPRYSFLQDFIPEKERDENLSSYKTNLIYKMDKYQQDYKFVYGEIFPAYKKETMPETKADYTVSNLLNEISKCEDVEAYQQQRQEQRREKHAVGIGGQGLLSVLQHGAKAGHRFGIQVHDAQVGIDGL